jgi:hypothetical protein
MRLDLDWRWCVREISFWRERRSGGCNVPPGRGIARGQQGFRLPLASGICLQRLGVRRDVSSLSGTDNGAAGVSCPYLTAQVQNRLCCPPDVSAGGLRLLTRGLSLTINSPFENSRTRCANSARTSLGDARS